MSHEIDRDSAAQADNVSLITEFAALIQGGSPTICRIVEGVDTERARDGDTITDVLLSCCPAVLLSCCPAVLLSCCGSLGGQGPSLYINPPAEAFAHCIGGIEDELQQARETGRNLVLLASDGDILQTWLVTDDTAAILKPLVAPQGSSVPGASAAVSTVKGA